MTRPKWSQKLLSNQAIEQIRLAIEDAEKKTSAEIVPMLVKRSAFVRHVPFTLMVISLAVLGFCHAPQWQFWFFPQLPLWLWVLLDGLILLGAVFWLSHQLWVQRWLTPYKDEVEATQARAEVEFYRSSIYRTHGKTGVLLFVSVMERRAVVLADKAIAEKFKPEVWGNILTKIVEHLKRGQWEKAYTDAIAMTADLLVESFPVANDDKNELPNQLIIKD